MKYFNKKLQLNANGNKTIKNIIELSDKTLKNEYLQYYRYKNEEINIFMFNLQLLNDKVKYLYNHNTFITDIKEIYEQCNLIHKLENLIDDASKTLKNREYTKASDAAFHFIVWNNDNKIKINAMIEEYNSI